MSLSSFYRLCTVVNVFFMLWLTIPLSLKADNLPEDFQRLPKVHSLVDDTKHDFVRRQGKKLYANGHVFRYVGVNRDDLAGGHLANKCSQGLDPQILLEQQDDFFANLKKHGVSVVRFWAFQNFAGPNGKDFSGFDQIIQLAKKYGIYLILTLENHWSDCTFPESNKDPSWYRDGYLQSSGYSLHFEDYVRAIVNYYQNEPQILAWQIVNDAKAHQTPEILADFMDRFAKLIKSIDKNHLVSGGAALQCWEDLRGIRDYKNFNRSSAVDILDSHDYNVEREPWPVCLANAVSVASQLDKVIIVGESGMRLTEHFTQTQRADLLTKKALAAFQRPVSGYMFWSFNNTKKSSADFDISVDDPLLHQWTKISKMLQRESTAAEGESASNNHISLYNAQGYNAKASSQPALCQITLHQRLHKNATDPQQTMLALDFTLTTQHLSQVPGSWQLTIHIVDNVRLDSSWNWQAALLSVEEDRFLQGEIASSWQDLTLPIHAGVQLLGQPDLLNIDAAWLNGQPCDVLWP